MDVMPCAVCQRPLRQCRARVCKHCPRMWHESCRFKLDHRIDCQCTEFVTVENDIPDACVGEGCKSKDSPLCQSCKARALKHMESFVLSKPTVSLRDAVCKGCSMAPLMGCTGLSGLSSYRFRAGVDVLKQSNVILIKGDSVEHIFNIMIRELYQRGLQADLLTYQFQCKPSSAAIKAFKRYAYTYTAQPDALLHLSHGVIRPRTKHMIFDKESLVAALKLRAHQGILVSDIYCEYPNAFNDFKDVCSKGKVTCIGDSAFYIFPQYQKVEGALSQWSEAIE